MRPRLYKTDHLAPLKADRAMLHEIAVSFAEQEFSRRGKCPFVWLLAIDNDIVWIETPWDDDREKNLSVTAVEVMMEKFGAHAYAHTIEAWLAKYEKEEWPEDGDLNKITLPSDLPKNRRDDVLMVFSFDKDDNHASSRYLVSLRPNGNNLLGPRIDEDEKFEGRMGNLLIKRRAEKS